MWVFVQPAAAADAGVAHAPYESATTAAGNGPPGQWGGTLSPSPPRAPDAAMPVERPTSVILPVRFTVPDVADSPAPATAQAAADSSPNIYEPIKLGQQGDPENGALKDPRAPTFTGSAITVSASLAIVLGLFFVLVWITRRNSPRSSTMLSSEVVQVLGRVPLCGRQQMHLVRIGGKLLLVAVTPTGAETLTEVTDPQEVDQLAALCQQSQPGSIANSFRSLIDQMGRKPTASQRSEDAPQDNPESTGRRPATETSENWEGRRVT